MNRNVTYALFAFVCLLLLAAGAVFAGARRAHRKVGKVRVQVINEVDNYFIGDGEVLQLITHDGAQPLRGQTPDSLDLRELETRLLTNPYVQDAQVSRDLTGGVLVRIRQRRPLARLIHPDATDDRYVAEDGRLLPLSSRYTARVLPLAAAPGGPVLSEAFFQDSVGKSYLNLVERLSTDAFWHAQVAQLTIQPGGKVVLWPQVGDQLIEFGYADRISEKLNKLLVFYKQVLPAVGWDQYQRVNVEFRNQIVCQ